MNFLFHFRCYGDHKHSRRVLQRALKTVTDWPESICSEYIRLEREEGSLIDLYIAETRVADIRAQVIGIFRHAYSHWPLFYWKLDTLQSHRSDVVVAFCSPKELTE